MCNNLTIIIWVMFFILLLICTSSYSERLTTTSTSILSNESIQNMASLLNSGQGTVQNLRVIGTLQIGNVSLTSNEDGSVNFGSSKLLQDGTIQFGNSKLTPDGNMIIGNQSIKTDGTYLNPKLQWKTKTANWQISPEGDVLMVRNIDAKTDSRVAFLPNAFADISTNFSSRGNVFGKTLSVPNYTLSNYAVCAGRSFGIEDSVGKRVYAMWDDHLRTVTPGTCTDKGRMDL